jgi:hypothetical protein
VLYELLTDDRFYGDMQSRQIWSVVGAGNHVPRAWHEVPEALQAVLARALAPRPEGRFASCADFAAALVAACPEADDAVTLEGVGAIVRRLKPDELDLIASARLALAAWDENPASASLQHASSGPTERLDRVEMTESVSRRSSSHRSGSATRSGARRHPTVPGPDGVDPPTAETSATAMERPLEPPRRRPPLLAAAAGVVVVIAVGVGLGVAIGRAPPPPPVVVTAPAPPPTPIAAPPAPVVAPPPPVPVAAPVEPVGSPPPPPPRRVGPKGKPPHVVRYERLKASCDHPCVALLAQADTSQVAAFEFLLGQCVKSCSP